MNTSTNNSSNEAENGNKSKPLLAVVVSDSEQNNALREIRKLINILENHGNCLVPSLDNKETTALERLKFFTEKVISWGYDLDEIQIMVNELE
jgi:hypothetical protein